MFEHTKHQNPWLSLLLIGTCSLFISSLQDWILPFHHPVFHLFFCLLRTDYRQADPSNLLLMGAPDLLAEVAAPRVAEYRPSGAGEGPWVVHT